MLCISHISTVITRDGLFYILDKKMLLCIQFDINFCIIYNFNYLKSIVKLIIMEERLNSESMMINNVAVVIPALEPDNKLVELVENLRFHFNKILVINDGSSKAHDLIFNKVSDIGATVIKHHVNMEKVGH